MPSKRRMQFKAASLYVGDQLILPSGNRAPITKVDLVGHRERVILYYNDPVHGPKREVVPQDKVLEVIREYPLPDSPNRTYNG